MEDSQQPFTSLLQNPRTIKLIPTSVKNNPI